MSDNAFNISLFAHSCIIKLFLPIYHYNFQIYDNRGLLKLIYEQYYSMWIPICQKCDICVTLFSLTVVYEKFMAQPPYFTLVMSQYRGPIF